MLGTFVKASQFYRCGLVKIAYLESQAYEQISDQYDEGMKKAAAGQKTITKERKLVERGKSLMGEAEAVYNTRQ